MILEKGKYYHQQKMGIREIFKVVKIREESFLGYDIWCSIPEYASGSENDPWMSKYQDLGEDFYEITQETFPEYFI